MVHTITLTCLLASSPGPIYSQLFFIFFISLLNIERLFIVVRSMLKAGNGPGDEADILYCLP